MFSDHNEYNNPLLKVSQPKIVKGFASLLLKLFIIVILSLLFVPWQQTASGYGKVIAFSREDREQILKAPITGKIVAWHVQEGDFVQEGTLIVDLEDNASEILSKLDDERKALDLELEANIASIQSLESQIKSLADVKNLSLLAADADIRGGQQNIKAAQSELDGTNAELNLDQKNSNRRQKLQSQGLSSERDLKLAEFKTSKSNTEVFKSKSKLEKAKAELLSKQAAREKKAADMDAKILKERVNIEKIKAEIAKINGKKAQLDVKIQRQNAQKIYAPKAGWISRIESNQNEQVKAGDKLANFIPQSNHKAVELWVKGNDAPLITKNRKVRLQFEGWPAVQFSGWPSVAVGTFGGEVLFVDYMANSNGQFRVLVQADQNDIPWPDSTYLRQGAKAYAWVLLDEVPLGFELWRQLNGFPASIANKHHSDKNKEKKKEDKEEKIDKEEKDEEK